MKGRWRGLPQGQAGVHLFVYPNMVEWGKSSSLTDAFTDYECWEGSTAHTTYHRVLDEEHIYV